MKSLIFISIALVLFACSESTKKKPGSELKVVVNSDFQKYFDEPGAQGKRADSIYYDSARNITVSRFGFLRNGKIKVRVLYLLTNDIEQEINLQHDTIIILDTSLYASFNSASINDFLKFQGADSDTIFLGQKMISCFGGSIEKNDDLQVW